MLRADRLVGTHHADYLYPTRAPSFEPEGRAEVSFGNYGRKEWRFSASGPLIADVAALRAGLRLLEREEAFVVPTSHEGETLARFAIVNPLTSEDDITEILDTMA